MSFKSKRETIVGACQFFYKCFFFVWNMNNGSFELISLLKISRYYAVCLKMKITNLKKNEQLVEKEFCNIIKRKKGTMLVVVVCSYVLRCFFFRNTRFMVYRDRFTEKSNLVKRSIHTLMPSNSRIPLPEVLMSGKDFKSSTRSLTSSSD